MTTPNEELLARLPELPKGVAPVHVYDASVGNKWAPPCTDYYTADQMRDYAIAALARQEEGREAEWPLFTWSGIAPRKLDALRSQGWSVNGYALYRDGMRGLIDLHGAVHWVGDSPTPTSQSAGVSDAYRELMEVRAGLCTLGVMGPGETAAEALQRYVTRCTAAGAAPEGFVLVPRIPTREMWAAANGGNCWEDAYARMLAASPQPGAQHGQEVMRDDAAFHGRIGRLSLPTDEGAAHD